MTTVREEAVPAAAIGFTDIRIIGNGVDHYRPRAALNAGEADAGEINVFRIRGETDGVQTGREIYLFRAGFGREVGRGKGMNALIFRAFRFRSDKELLAILVAVNCEEIVFGLVFRVAK